MACFGSPARRLPLRWGGAFVASNRLRITALFGYAVRKNQLQVLVSGAMGWRQVTRPVLPAKYSGRSMAHGLVHAHRIRLSGSPWSFRDNDIRSNDSFERRAKTPVGERLDARSGVAVFARNVTTKS